MITEGEWKVKGYFVVIDEKGEEIIRTVARKTADGVNERIANARLIAAAPDLYEACRRAQTRLFELGQSESMRTLKIMKEALAKAEGK